MIKPNRSSRHNRFFHAILRETLTFDKLVFDEIQVNGISFEFSPKRVFGIKKDGTQRLKHFIKSLDFNYPLDGEDKASSTKLDDKELALHIDFIMSTASKSGYSYKSKDAEWERAMAQYRN